LRSIAAKTLWPEEADDAAVRAAPCRRRHRKNSIEKLPEAALTRVVGARRDAFPEPGVRRWRSPAPFCADAPFLPCCDEHPSALERKMKRLVQTELANYGGPHHL